MLSAARWPAYASLLAGAGTLALMWYLARYRGKPGATWFVAALGAQAVWAFSYGAALFVFDPALRLALELLWWLGMVAIGPLFLAFALSYTGRTDLLHAPWARLLGAVTVVSGALVATNPLHHLLWSGFRVAPLAGMATVRYTLTAGAFLVVSVSFVGVVLGSVLLFDTVVSYGPLYRGEAVAVGFSTLPPGVAMLVWLFGVGPVPALNLAPVAFVPHVLLDAYAFAASDMFEFHPATRRAGERAALDDLGSPVVIVDEERRVVTLNRAAVDAFGVGKEAALTAPLTDLLDGAEVDPAAGDQRVTVATTGGRREFKVVPTRLRDASGTHVGHTVVFQDVTAEVRREQRLAVLNRFLRHNVRNESAVIVGRAEVLEEAAGDGLAGHAATIREAVGRLADSAEKARTLAESVDESATEPVALPDLVGDAADAVRRDAGAPADAVSVDVPPLTVRTNPALLAAVVETLVENALEHGGEGVSVSVTAAREDGHVAVAVADDGPGIPDHELAVVRDGDETPLEHGSGLGLWLAEWGTAMLGGDLAFETGDGTTATVRIPVAGEAGEDGADGADGPDGPDRAAAGTD